MRGRNFLIPDRRENIRDIGYGNVSTSINRLPQRRVLVREGSGECVRGKTFFCGRWVILRYERIEFGREAVCSRSVFLFPAGAAWVRLGSEYVRFGAVGCGVGAVGRGIGAAAAQVADSRGNYSHRSQSLRMDRDRLNARVYVTRTRRFGVNWCSMGSEGFGMVRNGAAWGRTGAEWIADQERIGAVPARIRRGRDKH